MSLDHRAVPESKKILGEKLYNDEICQNSIKANKKNNKVDKPVQS